MAAPERFADRSIPLAPRAPSIHGPSATSLDVRFSNRPFRVKHFQTIHHCSVDVARRLALLFGLGTKAGRLPHLSGVKRTRVRRVKIDGS